MSEKGGVFDFFFNDEELSKQLQGEKNVVTIPFDKLYIFDPDYGMEFIKKPVENYKYLSDNARRLAGRKLDLNIINVPNVKPIHLVKSDDILTLIQVNGTVTQRSGKLMKPNKLAYECPVCGEIIPILQDKQWRISPDKCICENKKNFITRYDKTEFINVQWIELQETPEKLPHGKNPEKIKVMLKGSLVDSCLPGEIIEVTGVPKILENRPNTKKLEMEYYIESTGVNNNTEHQTIKLTKEDEEHVKKLMKDEEYYSKLIQSIAPTLYGLDKVKEACALQQCEGQVKYLNKTRVRGQFHILLAGPPGCGKSELGDFMVKCHPKGRKAIGKGSSGVGLTASVVKDGDNFVLRACAMSLADNGFLFIDELDKMSSNDSGAMHPGMEQQKIKINKADIDAELNTRCSILSACNPVGGRWDTNEYPLNNLMDDKKGLPRPLIDRFALIFIIRQNMDSERERKVIDHIMKANSNPNTIKPPYNVDTLRKIFAYARSIKVTIPEEMTKDLSAFCLVLYEADKIGEMSVITRRQPRDLIRLAESSARLNGRSKVIQEDVDKAKEIIAYSMQSYGVNPLTGKIDQETALYGPKKPVAEMIKDVPQLIRRLKRRSLDDEKHVTKRDLVAYLCQTWGIESNEAEKLIEVLLKDGTIFHPSPGCIEIS